MSATSRAVLGPTLQPQLVLARRPQPSCACSSSSSFSGVGSSRVASSSAAGGSRQQPGLQQRRRRQCEQRQQRGVAAAAGTPDLDALLAGLEAPDIGGDLADLQTEQGAVFDDDGVAVHFKNDSRAMYALEHSAVVVDRSHWGRLRLAGDDRLAFLHGQSTADIEALVGGAGCETVFVTAQARCLDLASVYAQGSGLMVVLSPGTKDALLERLNKYIFPNDKVQVMDVSARTCMFSLLGPQADAVLSTLGANSVAGAADNSHSLLSYSGKPVIVAKGGGLPGPGYTFIADESVAVDVWRALTAQEGVEPLGSDGWEMARVLAGRPAPGRELTEDYNPLEAGLYHAVSVNKGCYIGQETLAKVSNLNAVKQQLWGLDMASPCKVGDAVTAAADGAVLGTVTSYVDTPSGQHRALAYLKCRKEGKQVDLEGTPVVVDGSKGVVVAPPFLSRAFADAPEEAAAVVSGGGGGGAAAAEAQRRKEEEEAAAAAARAEKLRAMQQRLAEFQQQQEAAGGQQ